MRFSTKQFATAWYQALTEAPADQATVSKQFLTYLRDHGQLKRVNAIVQYIAEMLQAQTGVVAVTVRSKHQLPAEVVAGLVKQHFGDATVTSVLDDSLIGGLRLETANQRVDLSVQGRLAQLAEHFHS